MENPQWTPEQIKTILGEELKERTDPKVYERKLPYLSFRRREGATDAEMEQALGYKPFVPSKAKD